MRLIVFLSCFLLSGCWATTFSGIRAGVDVINLMTKSPPVIVKSLECGNIEPIKPSRSDTEGTKQQIVEQAIKLEKLCPDE